MLLMITRTGIFNRVRLNLWREFTSNLQSRRVYFSTVNKSITSPEKPKTPASNPTSSQENCVQPSFGPFPPYSPPSFYRHTFGTRSCLQKFVEAPDQFSDIIYWRNRNVMVVYEKTPKARVHLVVVSTRCRLGQMFNITKEHLPHIKEMSEVAESIISSLEKDENLGKAGFQYGFHAISPMEQLPLHLISRDYILEAFTHRKHWQSFNSGFFLPARTVVSMLERNCQFKKPRSYLEMLRQRLYCHRCTRTFPTVPKLKRHIEQCEA